MIADLRRFRNADFGLVTTFSKILVRKVWDIVQKRKRMQSKY